MRKWIILSLCLLLCLWTASAFAQGILPVLQTPMPEITQAVSLHALRCEEAPVPKAPGNGVYTYEYSKVTYNQYQNFGRVLGQDGFVFESSETSEKGVVTSVVKRGWAKVTVTYNPVAMALSVSYPPRVEAMETDKDNPCRAAADAVSILPEIPHTVSLENITGWNSDKTETVEDGTRYRYSAVSYDGYSALSVALGQEGYSLVTAEALEDGTSRAVVSDGSVSLTIDYNLDTQVASVTYPIGVCPREANLFDDFNEIGIGQTIQTMEGVKVTFLGWETTDNWYSYWRNTNWIPAKTGYSEHAAEEGTKHVWMEFRVDYNRPEEMGLLGLLRNKAAYDEQRIISFNNGGKDAAFKLDSVSSWNMSGEKSNIIAVVITLRDSQIARLDNIRFTFSSTDYLQRYAVRLTEENRKPAEEAQ